MADVIGFDAAAWSIDGARIKSDVMRVLAYAATAGAEGVVAPGDARVHALAVPGPQVAVDPGAVIIRNRSTGVRSQSYVANGRTETRLDVAATTSAGGRSDLVVLRIEDPQFSPWPKPSASEAPDHQYVRPFVIQGVPASTTSATGLNLGYSAYALARIDIPANTGTITDGMIKPLRELALPRTHREVLMSNPTPEKPLTSTGGTVWPDYRPSVKVPSWATSAYVIATLSSVGHRDGAVMGQMTAVLDGALSGAAGFRAADIGYDLDAPPSNGERHTLIIGGGWADIRSIAGKTVPLQIEAKKYPGEPGYLVTVAGTQLIFDIQFYERAV